MSKQEEKPKPHSQSSLKRKLAEEIEKKEEYLNGWRRAKADAINEHARYQKMLTEERIQGVTALLLSLIPTLDSFESACKQTEDNQNISSWKEGMEQTEKQLLVALKEHNIEAYTPLDEHFNPAYHESVATIPVTKKKDDGKIMGVFQRGYRIGTRVVRPAKVSVGEYKTDKKDKN